MVPELVFLRFRSGGAAFDNPGGQVPQRSAVGQTDPAAEEERPPSPQAAEELRHRDGVPPGRVAEET